MGLRGGSAAARLHLQRRGARAVPRPAARTDRGSPSRGRGSSRSPPTRRCPVLGERLWVSGFTAAGDVPASPCTPSAGPSGRRCWTGRSPRSSAPGFDVRRGPAADRSRPGPGHPGRARRHPARPGRRQAYQPLAHRSREEFNHCLCTPLLAGASSRTCGSARPGCCRSPSRACPSRWSSSTSAWPRWRPSGMSRSARRARHRWPGSPPIWPGPARSSRRVRQKLDFANPSESGQRQRIQVTRALSAPGQTTLEWTLTTLDRQASRVLDYGPPVESAVPDGVELLGSSQASGPVLRVGSARLPNLWSRTTGLQPDRVRVPVHRDRRSGRPGCGRPGCRPAW